MKKLYIVSMLALMHEGKRYEVGSEIELTDEEYKKVSQYVRPAPEKPVSQIPATKAEKQTPDTQKENGNEQKEEKTIPKTESQNQSQEAAGDGSGTGDADGTGGTDAGSADAGQSGTADADQSVQAGDGENVTPEKPAKAGTKTTKGK
jgi:hypothetical protein